MPPREADGERRAFPERPALRFWLVGLATLVLLWLSIGISGAHFLQARQPQLALTFWPWDGLAQANLALQTISADHTARDVARDRAAAAFRAEPTAVRAVSLLAMLAPNAAAVHAGFGFSRQLSRRDLAANLYFIDRAVSRNDIRGALREYDVALRTSRISAPRVLFPILDSAMAQPGLAASVGDLLAEGAEWVPEFITFSLQRGTNVSALARALAYRPVALTMVPREAQLQLIAALTDQRDFPGAALIHWRLARGASSGLIRDSSFNAPGAWPPFDWSLVSAGGFGAVLVAEDGALRIFAEAGSGGTVARQLVHLASGRYRMRSTAVVTRGAGGGRALWSLACAGREGRTLGTMPIAGREGSSQTTEAAIVVPVGCSWQWLGLVVENPNAGGSFVALVQDVDLTAG